MNIINDINRDFIPYFIQAINWGMPQYTRYLKTGTISTNIDGTWNIDSEFRIEFVDDYSLENIINRNQVKIAAAANIAFPALLTTNNRCYGYFDQNGSIQYTLSAPGVDNQDGTYVHKDSWFGVFTTQDNSTIDSFSYLLSDAAPESISSLSTGAEKIYGGDVTWRLDTGNIVFDIEETKIKAAFCNKHNGPAGRRLSGIATINAINGFSYSLFEQNGSLIGSQTFLNYDKYGDGSGTLANLTGNDASWIDFYIDGTMGSVNAIQGSDYNSYNTVVNNSDLQEPSEVNPSFLPDNLFLGRLYYRRTTNINNYVGGNQQNFISFNPYN